MERLVTVVPMRMDAMRDVSSGRPRGCASPVAFSRILKAAVVESGCSLLFVGHAEKLDREET